MNITEDECAKCGSTLEQVRPGKWQCTKCDLDQMMAGHYNAGYQAGLAKAQRDDDDAFWIRQYAGQAMQGLLANPNYTYMLENNPSFDADQIKEMVAINAIGYAKALLEEVRRHETANTLP